MRGMGVIYVGKYHDGSLEPRGRDDSGVWWCLNFLRSKLILARNPREFVMVVG
jgi:hypothetical protein